MVPAGSLPPRFLRCLRRQNKIIKLNTAIAPAAPTPPAMATVLVIPPLPLPFLSWWPPPVSLGFNPGIRVEAALEKLDVAVVLDVPNDGEGVIDGDVIAVVSVVLDGAELVGAAVNVLSDIEIELEAGGP